LRGLELAFRNFRRVNLVGKADHEIPSVIDEVLRAMSPKKTILRTLSEQVNGDGTPAPIHPSTIPGFQQAPGKYQETINALLKDRMIEGNRDADGRMAISLNSHREKDVRKVLRPAWAHPAVLLALALFAAVAGFGFLV